MKTLALIKRRSDTTRDAFRDHYEQVHAPLAIDTLLEGVARYVRYHLREEIFGEPGFDVVTGFWYRGVEAALDVQRRLTGPEGERILQDELTFMDKPANTFFPVTEHPVAGKQDPEAGLRAIAMARAPAGVGVAEFVGRYEADRVPALLDAVREPRWCLQQRAVRIGAERPAFDVVTQLHAQGDAGLAAWARDLEGAGARVVVASVSEHESELP